jgi:monoamine oxidase
VPAAEPMPFPLQGYLKGGTILSIFAVLALLPHGFAATIHTDASTKTTVAIIGGGMSGATAAYTLSQFSKDVKITVFEAGDVPGGRLQEVVLDSGKVLELGGSIGIPANKYFVQFSDLLGLTRVKPGLQDASIGAWDGKRFRIKIKASLWSRLEVMRRCSMSHKRQYCRPASPKVAQEQQATSFVSGFTVHMFLAAHEEST